MMAEKVDSVHEIAFGQTMATLGSLQLGETITLEEVFHDVGQRLVAEGLVPDFYGTDEWAQVMAEEFSKNKTVPEEVVGNKEK